MKTAAAAALALALAITPVRAQAFELGGMWSSAVSGLGEAAAFVVQPLRSAWSATLRLVLGAEHALAAHVTVFASTLRDDFARFEVLVGRAGFRITTVNVKPGLIPEIELLFELAATVSAEDESQLRAELAALQGIGGALERTILLTLLDIDQWVESVRPDGFRISEIGMALIAIIPELTVSFTRE